MFRIIALLCLSHFFVSFNSVAQSSWFVEESKVCDESSDFSKILPVESFADEFKLTVQLDSIMIGEKTIALDYFYQATFDQNSSIFRITAEMALQIRIARIVINDEKFYGCQIAMFRKKDNCWSEPYKDNEWEYFNLGNEFFNHVSSRNGFADARLGFAGVIRVD